MKIFITEEFLLESIQNEFRAIYPNLKILFFKNPHAPYEGSLPSELLPAGTPIDEIRNIHSAGWIDVGPQVTARQLERQFQHLLGLNAQVFRRSGKVWLETTATDDRTLGELEALAAQVQAGPEIPETDLNEQT
ncbi:hypothetical protein [Chitinophaga alhagiae]|uniref:hypothetical protein n=1 Tax=Chitinophaga alhagiae TaxID=2203219 RepID=UPI000E5C1289|nr:hypothetical protein [Chitinophaga alhagiae]